jgi:dipeptidase D
MLRLSFTAPSVVLELTICHAALCIHNAASIIFLVERKYNMTERLIELFEQISAIPRASGNEQGISNYLIDFAHKQGLVCTRDEFFNVIIEKPAAKGKESNCALFVQAHMDMVCEKAEGSSHDFISEGISIICEGDFLLAKDTSLGADNGIGMAMLLQLLEEDLNNPPIVAIFTSDEERGLRGVKNLNLSAYSNISTLINLDGEEEDVFLTSCAGGVRCLFELPISRQAYEKDSNTTQLSISIKGLNGGHSGLKIDQEYANAIILIARILRNIMEAMSIKLLDISGGGKENSIPTNAKATIALNYQQREHLYKLIEHLTTEINTEYFTTEKQIEIKVIENTDEYTSFVDSIDIQRLVDLAMLLPNGLIKRDIEMGCPITSSNLSTLNVLEDKIIVRAMIRSNIDSLKYEVCSQFTALARLLGCEISLNNDYPAWEHKSDSRVRKHFIDVYFEQFNAYPKLESIHGGLECAYLAQKLSNLDMIAIGCNIYDVHSVKEKLSISSAMRTYRLLKSAIESM